MSDDVSNSQNNFAELPKGASADDASQGGINQGVRASNGGDSPQTTNSRQPRVKGSHRKGTPPKTKWL